MIFEIINPSDKCTLETSDHEVAAVTCCLIGTGKYALQGIDTDLEVPLFIFGDHDEWFTEKFNRDLDQSIEFIKANKLDELIVCLNGVLIGGAESRASFNKGMDLIDDPIKKEEWRQHWLDERRTSLNNICTRAWHYAESLQQLKNRALELVDSLGLEQAKEIIYNNPDKTATHYIIDTGCHYHSLEFHSFWSSELNDWDDSDFTSLEELKKHFKTVIDLSELKDLIRIYEGIKGVDHG